MSLQQHPSPQSDAPTDPRPAKAKPRARKTALPPPAEVTESPTVDDAGPATEAVELARTDPVTAADPDGTAKPEGRSRQHWRGLGMCDFIRYAASIGWPKPAITAVAASLGFSPSPTTVHIQAKNGRDGRKVPTVKKELADELTAHYAKVVGKVWREEAAPDGTAAEGTRRLGEKRPDKKSAKYPQNL
ncbi:hypothetical protein [Humisphaera borealis]|uniref:Uncharacterized protein n=1 Tax=Humisphaera borealis TaxID=2807512 RepID=A0A7M2WVS5_9BACT|nr:hypothetical protein [Humisphaera borealis]QOV89489.1 hypothetical protein IPV69_25390 [Humisphaera borealis]